jgi:hypothetical protein
MFPMIFFEYFNEYIVVGHSFFIIFTIVGIVTPPLYIPAINAQVVSHYQFVLSYVPDFLFEMFNTWFKRSKILFFRALFLVSIIFSVFLILEVLIYVLTSLVVAVIYIVLLPIRYLLNIGQLSKVKQD